MFRTAGLRLSLIVYQEELNRNWNRDICKKFDEMAGKLGEIPDHTKVPYLTTCLITILKKNLRTFIFKETLWRGRGGVR